MKIRKYSWVHLVLFGEFFCFLGMYSRGSNGISALWRAQEMNATKEQEVALLKNEVEDLKIQVHQWQTDSFYKEKVAREQLQMARPEDMIFIT